MTDRFFRQFENPAALLAIIVTALLSLGLVMVYSASGALAGLENIRVQAKLENRADEDYRFHHGSDYATKQVMWAAIGIAIGIGLMKTPVEKLEKYALPILVISLVLLALVTFTPLGVSSKGARRWLRLAGFTLQPSELAKIGLVIFMAKLLSMNRERMHEFMKGFMPAVATLGAFCVLMMLQKDLGTIMLMTTVVLGMWCLAQVRIKHLMLMGLLGLPVLVYLIFEHAYRLNRILAIMYPEKYADTYGYQLSQSLIAVGSGGTFGTGLGESLQKYHFLSESHTDFLLAIVCEEIGVVGALAICVLFLSFILLGFRIAYKSSDYFSSLLAAGITMIVGCGALINFCVVLGLAPTKGLPLPFFSYGGSSLLASLICTGLLIRIANEAFTREALKEDL